MLNMNMLQLLKVLKSIFDFYNHFRRDKKSATIE